jgi:methylated-DNA-[protein]-cysteine S-methyltransferase
MKLDLHKVQTPIGTLLLVTDAEGVVRALDFEHYAPRLHRSLGDLYGDYDLNDAQEKSPVESNLHRYFEGDLVALDEVKVAFQGSLFQQRVWGALREIPAGTTISYGQLAERLGFTDSKSAYEVSKANATNPIALIVPCHRVVGKNGDLKGYAWGLPRKRWLLIHENAELTRGMTARLEGF